MAEVAILIRSWPVGSRTATLSVPRPQPGKTLHASVEWEPCPPKALTSTEWMAYRTGRDKALSEIAAELDITVAVLDI